MTTARTITLRLHAALRDAAGTDRLDVAATDDATPRSVFDAAIARHAALEPWRDVVAFGTDDRLLPADATLPADLDTLHALPPVSGG